MLTEWFWRTAWEKVFMHNTGTWASHRVGKNPVPGSLCLQHQSPLSHQVAFQGSHTRNRLLWFLYQQSGNRKTNNALFSDFLLHLVAGRAILYESSPSVIPCKGPSSLAHLISKSSHQQKCVITVSVGPVQLMEAEESYTELGQISKFKPHLLYHLMVCQKVVTQSERG